MENKETEKVKKDIHGEEFVEKATRYISLSSTEEIMILRAQLLTEYYVNSLLVYLLPSDEGHYYSSDRVRFSDKIKKLKESEVFSSSEIEAIQRLNRLRNKFGHDIDYQVLESDVDYLGFCFGKDYLANKYRIDGDGKKTLKKDRLHTLLLDVCVIVAIELANLLKDKK